MKQEKLAFADVLEEVKSAFAETGIDREQLAEATRLKEDLHLDSVDLVDIIVTLERRLGITLDDHKVMRCKSIQEITAIAAIQCN